MSVLKGSSWILLRPTSPVSPERPPRLCCFGALCSTTNTCFLVVWQTTRDYHRSVEDFGWRWMIFERSLTIWEDFGWSLILAYTVLSLFFHDSSKTGRYNCAGHGISGLSWSGLPRGQKRWSQSQHQRSHIQSIASHSAYLHETRTTWDCSATIVCNGATRCYYC